jgi:hypothetical protein
MTGAFWEPDDAARSTYATVARFARERLADRVLAWDAAPETVPGTLLAELADLGLAGPPDGAPGAEDGGARQLAAALAALAEVDAGTALRVLVLRLVTGATACAGIRLPAAEPVGLGLRGAAGLVVIGAPPGSRLVVMADDGAADGGVARRGAAGGSRL